MLTIKPNCYDFNMQAPITHCCYSHFYVLTHLLLLHQPHFQRICEMSGSLRSAVTFSGLQADRLGLLK